MNAPLNAYNEWEDRLLAFVIVWERDAPSRLRSQQATTKHDLGNIAVDLNPYSLVTDR